jgi:hypothetical protein
VLVFLAQLASRVCSHLGYEPKETSGCYFKIDFFHSSLFPHSYIEASESITPWGNSHANWG